jgi:hypothetical protein
MSEWRNKEKLEELYLEEEMSMAEIADELGCADVTVQYWLDKHDIETRDKSFNSGYNQWYSDEEMLEWIDAFVEMFDVVPSGTDIRGWPGPALKTYEMRFGKFTEAVREAGYTPRGDKEKN